LAWAEAQHACGGKQQSAPAAQQATFVVEAGALALPKQHACCGLQQSAFGLQKLTFEADSAPLQAVPPPITPRSRARGANSFRDMGNLQYIKWSRNEEAHANEHSIGEAAQRRHAENEVIRAD
jgi:hypothetical protein